MRTTFLTVITPVFNGERFIESCLRSVIDQKCPHIEHLIMDGGSTDKTLKIIERYIKCNSHIRLISEKDRGQSAAMNKGISLARGDIIGFLNVDDYYQPGVLPRILGIFQQLPDQSFLVGNCNVLNDDEEIAYVNKPSRLTFNNILIGGEKNQFPYNPSAYFYHKVLHKKVGLYDESNHYTLDLDFLLRVVRNAKVKYVDETWGNYRFIRGTKTFQSKEDNQLKSNETRVMNIYLKELTWFHREWISINRHYQHFLDKHSVYYYFDRIIDCLRNPREIYFIISRAFERHFIVHKREHGADVIIRNRFSTMDMKDTAHV